MAWPSLWLKSPPPLAPASIAISSCGRSPPPDGGWSSLLVVFASCPAHAFAGRRHKSIGQRGSRPGRHHSVTVGDIIQESRATSSHHTRATSSESAQGDRSQGASAALRLSTAKLLGQFDHLASVVSLIDFAKALAPFDLRAGGALAVTGSFQLDEGLPALTTVNATSAMAA